MSSITLHPRQTQSTTTHRDQQPPQPNPLPQLLQTPSGLAILELQGTINLPSSSADGDGQPGPAVSIGKLDFPDYVAGSDGAGEDWMRRVYLYVGEHQRLTGEVKKLPRPVAVVRRREVAGAAAEDAAPEELQVVDLVRYKLVFSQRPEPVGTAT